MKYLENSLHCRVAAEMYSVGGNFANSLAAEKPAGGRPVVVIIGLALIYFNF